MTQRIDRIGDLVRGELTELILREMRDPRVELATVSRVEVSRDLRHAQVHVSVLGSEEHRAEAISALEGAQGFLRRALAQRTSLRVTPELHFHLDRGAEHSQRISEILERLDPEEHDDA